MVLFAAATLPIRLINGSWNVCVSALLWSGVTLLSYALAPVLSPHLAKKHTHEHARTHTVAVKPRKDLWPLSTKSLTIYFCSKRSRETKVTQVSAFSCTGMSQTEVFSFI